MIFHKNYGNVFAVKSQFRAQESAEADKADLSVETSER